MKTIIKNPKLKIQSSEDGVWLHFKASNGKSAAINLTNQVGDGIIQKALRQWAVDYVKANPKLKL